MHDIEPFFLWQNLYESAKDPRSPFFRRHYSEIYFTHKIYNHIIHPQWDDFGSDTLFIKVLYAEYKEGFMVIEMMGEWNDCIYNDIMTFKRDFIDLVIDEGINKFILIGENVLNFHASDDSYYEEWYEDIEEGWVVLVNFHDHVIDEMNQERLGNYIHYGKAFNHLDWRRMKPKDFYRSINQLFDNKYLK